MSRVFPTDNERWAVKISIGNRISRLSNKNRAARKLSILQPVTKKQSLQKWKEGLVNFITESKRQISLDARESIKQIGQRERQLYAIFDMFQQHVLHSPQDDRHEPIAVKHLKNLSKKSAVNRSSAKKSSIGAKKPSAIAKKASVKATKPKVVAKKQSVTAKTASTAASKAPVKKPSATPMKKPSNGTEKKQSSSSIKRNVENSSKETAHSSAAQISNCLPDLSSDSSSDESTENVPVVEKASCPSMPILQFEEIESDDNLKEFMKKPIELAANAVKKRRQSDFASTTSTEFAVRKKTMPIHSSVLAISNRTPSAIVEPRTNGGHKGICSTPARTAVDETNNVPKIGAEKEPEPIPNFLKQKRQQDEEITKFERLRERMNQAMKAAEKGNASNSKSGDASGPANPVQEELVDEE